MNVLWPLVAEYVYDMFRVFDQSALYVVGYLYRMHPLTLTTNSNTGTLIRETCKSVITAAMVYFVSRSIFCRSEVPNKVTRASWYPELYSM